MGTQAELQKWKNNKVKIANTWKKRIWNQSLVQYQEKFRASSQDVKKKKKKSHNMKLNA